MNCVSYDSVDNYYDEICCQTMEVANIIPNVHIRIILCI